MLRPLTGKEYVELQRMNNTWLAILYGIQVSKHDAVAMAERMAECIDMTTTDRLWN